MSSYERIPILSPSKVTNWSSCKHYLTLEVENQRKISRSSRPAVPRDFNDASVLEPPTNFTEMLFSKGDFHEKNCLAEYKEIFDEDEIYEVPELEEPSTTDKTSAEFQTDYDQAWEQWVERENEILKEGRYKIIFQMPFISDGMRGIADFLERRELPDGGGFVYEPVDSKLTRSSAKKTHLLQLLFYAEAVERVMGKRPEKMHVALGRRDLVEQDPDRKGPPVQSFKIRDFWWYWKRVRKQLKLAVTPETAPETEAEKCSFCSFCWFFPICSDVWGPDSLNKLAACLTSHRDVLKAAGVDTIKKLALLEEHHLGEDLPYLSMSSEIVCDFEIVKAGWVAENPENGLAALHAGWENRDTENDINTDQLTKLWRQARLQSIRRWTAVCSNEECKKTFYLPEKSQNLSCPHCERKIATHLLELVEKGILDGIGTPHTHVFEREEILNKMTEKMAGKDISEWWKWQESLPYLPEMNDNDIYLDFEGHPLWTVEKGIIFLFGFIMKAPQEQIEDIFFNEKDGFLGEYKIEGEGEWKFVQLWSHDENGDPSSEFERKQAARLISGFHKWSNLCAKRGEEMHVYHYNHTERTLLADLADDSNPLSDVLSLLGASLEATDIGIKTQLKDLVEGKVFVDLLGVVRNSLQVGFSSCGLKNIEKLADFGRGNSVEVQEIEKGSSDGSSTADVAAGSDAVVRYELYANYQLYLDEEARKADQQRSEEHLKHLEDIAAYNHDDVKATREVHEWLLNKRKEPSNDLLDKTETLPDDEVAEELSPTAQEIRKVQTLIDVQILELASGS